MEEANRFEQTSQASHMRSRSLAFIAIFVTGGVFLRILTSWHTFGSVEKFAAVALLITIVITPARAIRAEGSGKTEIGRDEIAIWGYMCLMMASMLIGH